MARGTYALALTLAFICVLLAAAAIASERDENVIGRLSRGLVGLTNLVVVKVMLAALVAVVLGLVIAHDKALALFGSTKVALRTQYAFLALMVLYTVGGLWLLSRG